MLIKWIRCGVKKENKLLFSKGQEAWSTLKKTEGFIGQIGGWNKENPLEACIISMWKNSICYENFMRNVHDDIFKKSNQEKTYNKISVSLFNGSSMYKESGFTNTMCNGDTLKVAEYIADLTHPKNELKKCKGRHHSRISLSWR
ncbi:YdbC family protein [Rossellomorea aquimaris]|uniref:YdbC family protein n=1 Tax=Rossellomorea aquimaris TaxID=189382 RepID=UPI0007D04EF0|nr:YdbC family protein [Rossellomorea aquimaris]